MKGIDDCNDCNADKISVNKMNFDIINLHPKHSSVDATALKSEIEAVLFDIFKNYANKH